MKKKTYELSGYESEMIKPKELIEIKEATETLLALYAPRHVHTKTVKYSEAIQLNLGGLTVLEDAEYPFTLFTWRLILWFRSICLWFTGFMGAGQHKRRRFIFHIFGIHML